MRDPHDHLSFGPLLKACNRLIRSSQSFSIEIRLLCNVSDNRTESGTLKRGGRILSEKYCQSGLGTAPAIRFVIPFASDPIFRITHLQLERHPPFCKNHLQPQSSSFCCSHLPESRGRRARPRPEQRPTTVTRILRLKRHAFSATSAN